MEGLEELDARVVMPGDVVLPDIASLDGAVRLGPGLRQSQEGETVRAIVTKCGILRCKKPNLFWVNSSQRRPVPCRQEVAIGVVHKTGEKHIVDIGSNQMATLHSLSFEGATKRNKPKVQIGDLVYCRLTVANKDMEPEVECMTASGRAAGFGILTGGYLLTCSSGLCRKLLRPDCYVLEALGRHIAFETATGLNSRVWVSAPSPLDTVLVANAILASEFMDTKQIDKLVGSMLKEARR